MSSYQLFKRTRNIRSAARQMKPDEFWVKQTRETLLMQVKNSRPAKPEGQSFISRAFKIFVPVVSFKWMRAPVAIATAIIIMLSGGLLFSVSASERALPGDFLYSIKLVTEQARIALVSEPDEKVKLKAEFTKRRVDEMKQVLASSLPDKSDRVQQAAETLRRDMDTIKNQLDLAEKESTPEEVKNAANLVDEQISALITDLQGAKISLSTVEKIKISEAQAAASDASLKIIEVLLRTHFKDADTVSQEELLDCLKNYNIQVTENVTNSINQIEAKEKETSDLDEGVLTDPSSEAHEMINSSASASSVIMEAGESISSSDDPLNESKDNDSEENVESSPDSDSKEQARETEESPDTAQQQKDENAKKSLKEALESFTKADKLANEKDLDKAVEMLKLGTEQAYAAQKMIEENEVQEALLTAEEAGVNDTEQQEESQDDKITTEMESVKNPDQNQKADSVETEEQVDSEQRNQEPAEAIPKESTSTEQTADQESTEETDTPQSQDNP